MTKPAQLLLLVLLGLNAAPAAAQSPKALLDAPVWYVDLQVSLDANRSDTQPIEGGGTRTETLTMHRTLSGIAKLDLRNPGSVIGMTMQAMKDPSSIRPEVVLAQMDHMANWMEGADDAPAEMADMQKFLDDRSFVSTLQYERTEQTLGAHNEMGDLFDGTSHTTASGTARLSVWQSVKFELDTSAMKYWIVIPYSFELPLDATKGTTETRTQLKSGGPPDVHTEEVGNDNFTRELKLDTPSGMGDYPVVVGTLPSGSAGISGETSVAVHLKERNFVTPGRLTVKYALTQKAPAGGTKGQ